MANSDPGLEGFERSVEFLKLARQLCFSATGPHRATFLKRVRDDYIGNPSATTEFKMSWTSPTS